MADLELLLLRELLLTAGELALELVLDLTFVLREAVPELLLLLAARLFTDLSLVLLVLLLLAVSVLLALLAAPLLTVLGEEAFLVVVVVLVTVLSRVTGSFRFMLPPRLLVILLDLPALPL